MHHQNKSNEMYYLYGLRSFLKKKIEIISLIKILIIFIPMKKIKIFTIIL